MVHIFQGKILSICHNIITGIKDNTQAMQDNLQFVIQIFVDKVSTLLSKIMCKLQTLSMLVCILLHVIRTSS